MTRHVLETDETGRGHVIGGQHDGAQVVSKVLTTPPLVIMLAVPATGPNGQSGFDLNIESPAGLPFAQAVSVLEAAAQHARAALEAGRAPW